MFYPVRVCVCVKICWLIRSMFRCFNFPIAADISLFWAVLVVRQVTEVKMSDLSKKLPSELSQQALEVGMDGRYLSGPSYLVMFWSKHV